MSESPKVSWEQHQSIEWTTGIPTGKSSVCSGYFDVGEIECSLKLKTGVKYQLTLSAQRRPPSTFQITTYLLKGKKLWKPITTSLYLRQEKGVIWTCAKSQMPKVFPGKRSRLVTFKIMFHIGPTAEEFPVYNQTMVPVHPDCSRKLIHDISKLQENTPDHDVRLLCDGQVLSAHKIVLSTRSEVFKVMFDTDMLENQTGLVDIKDMDFPVLRDFIRYIYTGQLPTLTYSLAVQLYQAGDKYDVNTLKDRCSEYFNYSLAYFLPEENIEILLLADAHNDQVLKKKTLRYIASMEIFKTWAGWQDFSNNYPQFASEVLNFYERRN